jgi:hypothetical protein
MVNRTSQKSRFFDQNMALLRQRKPKSRHFRALWPDRHSRKPFLPARSIHKGSETGTAQTRILADAVYISPWRKTAGTLQGHGPETLPDHEEELGNASWKRFHQTGSG